MRLTKKEVIEYFNGVSKTARAIQRNEAQVRKWKDGELTELMHLLCSKAIEEEEKKRKKNGTSKKNKITD